MSTPAPRPLLVYDGECGFCSSCVRWITARWPHGAEVQPWQQLGATRLAEIGLTIPDTEAAAWWVGTDGSRYRGHLAIAQALMWSDGWRRLAGRLLSMRVMYVPGAVGYWFIARYRHLLPGHAACGTRV